MTVTYNENDLSILDELDWAPPCDARRHSGPQLATHIVIYKTCPCIPAERFWCKPCLTSALSSRKLVRCPECGWVSTPRLHCELVVSWEPIRCR